MNNLKSQYKPYNNTFLYSPCLTMLFLSLSIIARYSLTYPFLINTNRSSSILIYPFLISSILSLSILFFPYLI